MDPAEADGNAEGRQRENEKNCIVVPNIVGFLPSSSLSESSRPFCAFFPPSFFHSRSLTLSAISHGERLVILSLLHFYFAGRSESLDEGEREDDGRGRSCDWAGKITGSLFPSVPAEKMSGTDGRGERARAGKSVLRVNIAVRTLFLPLFHSFGNRSNIDERDDARSVEGGHSKRPPRRRVIHQAALRRAFCISCAARFYRTSGERASAGGNFTRHSGRHPNENGCGLILERSPVL